MVVSIIPNMESLLASINHCSRGFLSAVSWSNMPPSAKNFCIICGQPPKSSAGRKVSRSGKSALCAANTSASRGRR